MARRGHCSCPQELVEKHNVLEDDLPDTRQVASDMISYYRSIVQDVSAATKWVASATQQAICNAMEIDHASITSQEEYDGVFAAFLSTKTAEADEEDNVAPLPARSASAVRCALHGPAGYASAYTTDCPARRASW